MRRLLAVLAAALLVPLTPASAAGGEVVFVADRPSSTTVDLASEVALDPDTLVVTSASPYVHLAIHAQGWVPLHLTWFPDGNWIGAGAAIPAGPATVVVYSEGPASIRFGAPGLAATMTVNVDDAIATTRVVRTLTPDANGTVESDIPFAYEGRAFVLNAVDRPAQNHLLQWTTFCTAAAGEPCGERPLPSVGGVTDDGTSRWDIHMNAPADWSPAHAYYKSTTIGDGGPATHTLVVMPIP